MKKVISTLSFVGLIASSIFAGNCGSTSSLTPRPQTGTAGLTPLADSLPVVRVGQAINQVIYFENYDTTRTGGTLIKIQTLKIDSIENLPAGLCWKTNKANNTFAGKETGVIEVTGTTNAAPGQYKLKIKISVVTNLAPLNNLDAEAATGLRYHVRVGCGNTDLPVDSAAKPGSNPLYPAFIADNRTCPVSIENITENISEVSVMPNPFTTATNVTFSSEKEERYSVRLTNMLGSVVSSQEITSKNGGNNTVTIENKNFNTGIYFVSITNGKSSITKRVVIE
jgi:hypothetical protein